MCYFDEIRLASILHVSGRISQKTGLAPSKTITSAVEIKEKGVVIISSPGLIPKTSMILSASVPLATDMQYFEH